MLTVWLAVTDATVANGCLVVVPGSHRAATTLHCPGTVFPAELEDETDGIRWSFDLRYQPIGEPTGREVFPGFVARSATHAVVDDPDEWARLWWGARDRIAAGETAVTFGGRWNANAGQAVCA